MKRSDANAAAITSASPRSAKRYVMPSRMRPLGAAASRSTGRGRSEKAASATAANVAASIRSAAFTPPAAATMPPSAGPPMKPA